MSIYAVLPHQLGVLALLYNAPFVHDEYPISVFNGRKPVRDDDCCFVFQQLIEGTHQLFFVFGIDAGRRFVEDDNGTRFEHCPRDGPPVIPCRSHSAIP